MPIGDVRKKPFEVALRERRGARLGRHERDAVFFADCAGRQRAARLVAADHGHDLVLRDEPHRLALGCRGVALVIGEDQLDLASAQAGKAYAPFAKSQTERGRDDPRSRSAHRPRMPPSSAVPADAAPPDKRKQRADLDRLVGGPRGARRHRGGGDREGHFPKGAARRHFLILWFVPGRTASRTEACASMAGKSVAAGYANTSGSLAAVTCCPSIAKQSSGWCRIEAALARRRFRRYRL